MPSFALQPSSSAVENSELPQHLVTARKQKAAGLAISVSFLVASLILLINLDIQLDLPSVPLQFSSLSQILLPAVAGLAVLGSGAVAKKLSDDTMMIEVHKGRLYVQLEVPPRDAAAIPPGAVEVCYSAPSKSQMPYPESSCNVPNTRMICMTT